MKRNMARKRQLDVNKQERRKHLVTELWHGSQELLNDPVFVGKLVKGKIHCSCPVCATKTNTKKGTFGGGWKPSDVRKLNETSENALKQYIRAYDVLNEID